MNDTIMASFVGISAKALPPTENQLRAKISVNPTVYKNMKYVSEKPVEAETHEVVRQIVCKDGCAILEGRTCTTCDKGPRG